MSISLIRARVKSQIVIKMRTLNVQASVKGTRSRTPNGCRVMRKQDGNKRKGRVA